ncbi:carbon-nitrogen hydrolase family protein [Gallaecimonas mangrovi]|uniref:carbon-nitrogen hydrolase family protein n=1 Tax=Gallaecimonas mangrovi TaxID=2291597 RepID=UPI000E20420A|nr:carbon-nitrogen hydrolase family protein [Gallaecimonas mangrovi]
MVSIASCQYRVEKPSTLADWANKQAQLVAKADGDLLLFPEYASLEMLAWQPGRIAKSLSRCLNAMQQQRGLFVETYRALSGGFNKGIIAPSFPWQLDDGRVVNRAWYLEGGEVKGYSDKQIMTRFEHERWQISPGEPPSVLDFRGLKFAVQICYDVEFPMLSRHLIDHGAELILVPSCTDTLAGFHRVRIGCQARALENQTLVVQSPIVGEAPYAPAIFKNQGKAGFFTAPDYGLPDNGILAESQELIPASSQWLTQQLDITALAKVKEEGQVLNAADWPKQFER